MRFRLTGVMVLLLLQFNASSKNTNTCFEDNKAYAPQTDFASNDASSKDLTFSIKNIALSFSQMRSDSLELPKQLKSSFKEGIIESILIYPNPVTSDQINLKMKFNTSTDIRIDLMSVSGTLYKSLNQQDVSGQQMMMVDIRDLPAGMYIMNAYAGRESLTKKFVKQ